MELIHEIGDFLTEIGIDYYIIDGLIICDKSKLLLCPVEFKNYSQNPYRPELLIEREETVIYVYEDMWYSKREIVKDRISSNFSGLVSIYARNCNVKPITSQIAKEFLEKYHLLGNTSSKYKFGLFYKSELVAVSLFSKSRPMQRSGKEVESFEWVRFAVKRNIRITGGAGKLLDFFVQRVHPMEVMSYADKEWSNGKLYKRMGFTLLEETKPIIFNVNPLTFTRCKFSSLLNEKGSILVSNHGNFKFIKRLF